MNLVDKLEESDDIQDVYHNMQMTEELAAALDAD
jgi:transcriptional/translational regulatory protein YebC/TACO1